MSANIYPGSRWWKVDFHSHTPASFDYGSGVDQEELKLLEPRDWLLNYMRAEVDCVMITDHNTGAWIDRLKEALDELKNEDHADYRPISLFPGVEITVQGNIHILAIFSEDKTTSDIDSLLGALDYKEEKGNSDGCTTLSATAVIDKVVDNDGIAIPAHVDTAKGLFKEFNGNTLKQVLSNDNLYALEVIEPTYEKPQIYFDGKYNFSEVLGSDSHHPSGSEDKGQRYPGSHYTWVKMGSPSLEGIRLALIDGKMSLKRSDETEDPNVLPDNMIEKFSIKEAKYFARGNTTFDLSFNPSLNTLIGGRGTGKSSVVEFLRIALDRVGEIPERLEEDFEKYHIVDKAPKKDCEGLLTAESLFEIIYKKGNERYKISWSKNDTSHSIKKEIDGDWEPSEGALSERFPIRIYSQKQIFELAKDSQSLLQIIDDSEQVNYQDWKRGFEGIKGRYLTIKSEIRNLEKEVSEKSRLNGRLDDINNKLEALQTTKYSEKLEEYQLKIDQEREVLRWEESVFAELDKIEDFANNFSIPQFNNDVIQTELGEIRENLSEKLNFVSQELRNIKSQLTNLVQESNTLKESWKSSKSNLGIIKNISSVKKQYENLKEKLLLQGIDDPSAYSKLLELRRDISEQLSSIKEKEKLLKTKERESHDLLEELEMHRSSLTDARKLFLKDVLQGKDSEEISVRMTINQYTSKNICEEFRKVIKKEGNAFERIIGDFSTEDSLLYNLSIGKPHKIKELKNTILDIRSGESVNITDSRFLQHINDLPDEQIDYLMCWFPEDSLEIEYKQGKSGRYYSIEQGSPGQKTAALLAFILSYGNEPLILDQPEDDLDNKLVYELIVKSLREIKSKRQAIVVSHNANIVVNGDSENVVVLDVKLGLTKIVAQGGLQDIEIRREVCNVMEGGKEAFDNRYKRIGNFE